MFGNTQGRVHLVRGAWRLLTGAVLAGLLVTVTPVLPSDASDRGVVDELTADGSGEGAVGIALPKLAGLTDPAATIDGLPVPEGEIAGGIGWSDPAQDWTTVNQAGGDGSGGGDGGEVSAVDLVKVRDHDTEGPQAASPGVGTSDDPSLAPSPSDADAAGPVGVEVRPVGRDVSGEVWVRFGGWDTSAAPQVEDTPTPTPTPSPSPSPSPAPSLAPSPAPSPAGPPGAATPTPSGSPHDSATTSPALPGTGASPAAWKPAGAAAGSDGWSSLGGAGGVLDAEVSYAPLIGRFGADWASRAEVIAYPGCFWDRPGDAVCGQGEIVPSVNDEAHHTLMFATREGVSRGRHVSGSAQRSSWTGGGSADMRGMEVPAVGGTRQGSGARLVSRPAGGGSVYVVAAGVAGSNGDYGANPVAGSSSWQVGTGTGEFSSSYPFTLPASVAGAAPELGLSYSSGAVDGMTVAENGQPSMAGVGWDLGSSFITRSFVPCAQDAPRTSWRFKGDLCWKSDRKARPVQRLSIVLGGRSTTLVRVGTGNQYRLLDDPGWKVTRVVGRTGAAAKSPDNDGERFVVRTPDGTQYRFGFRPSAQSTWVVPVFGNDRGEPCHRATKARSWCQQAWRWSLDVVIDKDGNRTDYTYARESNYYSRFANRSAGYRTRYDRDGYLTKITYGMPATGGTPRAEVVMSTADRCVLALKDPSHVCTGAEGPRAKPSIWPDVPTDLICEKTGGCSNVSPGFFSTRRYDRISTRVRRVSTASGGAAGLYAADVYRLRFTMPDPDTPAGKDKPMLWLGQVDRTGYAAAGVSTRLPGVNFDGVKLQNRVTVRPGQLPFRKLRIGSVRNETGGRIQVVYGHQAGRACSPRYVAGRRQWASARECYPAKFGRPGSTPRTEWWHKYVVKRVAASDDAMGYRLGASTGGPLARLRVTDYSYGGAPGWRYVNDPLSAPGDRTWSDWRGYASTITHVRKVGASRVTAADVSRTRTLVYRGLHYTRANGKGDPRRVHLAPSEPGARRLPDWPWLAGRVVETDVLDPVTGARLSRDYSAYRSLVTAKPVAGSLPSGVGGWGKFAAQARYTYTARSVSRPRLVGSRLQHTVDTVVNAGGRTHRGILLGQITKTIDYGSSTAASPATSPSTGDSSADNTCITATYGFNSSTRLVVPTSSLTRNGCGGAVLARAQTLYDGQSTPSKTVTRGRMTRASAWASSASRIDTDYRYDVRGRQTGVSAPHTPGASAVWTTNTFNPGGNTWDPATWIKTTLPAPKAGGSSMTAQTRLDLRHGHPTSTIDVNGQTTSVTIDGLARVTSVSYPGHPSGVPNVGYAYAVSTKHPSRVVTRTLRDSAGGARSWDTSTTFADGWGRTLETHTPRVNAPDWPLVTATGYDEAGRQYLTLPGYIAPRSSAANQAGGSTTLANAGASTVEQAAVTRFDGMSRPTTTLHQSKGTTLWRDTSVYAGDTTTSRTGVNGGASNTDGTGLTLTTSTTDVFGRVRSTSEYGSAAITSTGQPATDADTTATYAYSPAGVLTGISSALPGASGGKASYRYVYDWLGRRTSTRDPDTGITTTRYDVASNPVTVIDAANAAAGIAVSTTYDRWNRPTKRRQTGAGGAKTLATWTYDTAKYGNGRPASTTAYTDLGTFTSKIDSYDARGQVTKTTQTYPAALTGEGSGQASKGVTLAYNQAGMETARVHPAVAGTTFNSVPITQSTRYTTGGLVSRIGSDSTSMHIPLGAAAYDKHNRPAQLVSGDPDKRLDRRYTYNPATGDLTGTSASDANGLQLSLAYSYDAAGRPIKISQSQASNPAVANSAQARASWCYRYDAVNRLTRATTGASGSVSGNTATCAGAANTAVTGANYDLTYTFDHTRLASITDRVTGAKATYAHTDPAHPHALTGTTQTGPVAAVNNGLLPAAGAMTYDSSGRVVTSTVGNPTAPGAQTAGTWSDPSTSSARGTGSTRTTYDAMGNPVKIAPLPGSLSGSGLTTIQAFDAEGNRVARQDKTPDGTVTSTVFLNGLDLTHTQGQDGKALTRYFSTPAGTPIATRSDLTGTDFVFIDAQQSIRLVKTNVSRTPGAISTHAYTPYGNPFTTRTKPTTTTGVDPEPRGTGYAAEPGDHGYLDKTHDPGGDLRLDHRSYTPTLGTLTTPDPLLDLADPQNLNPYSYAGNNPVAFADPSGLCSATSGAAACENDVAFTNQIDNTPVDQISHADLAHYNEIKSNAVAPEDNGGGIDLIAAAQHVVTSSYHMVKGSVSMVAHAFSGFGCYAYRTTPTGSNACLERASNDIAADSAEAFDGTVTTAATVSLLAGPEAAGGPAFLRGLLGRAAKRPVELAAKPAIGFADDAVGSAYQGMRSGGGHAIRHLRDEGLISNSGSLESQVSQFEKLTSPILRSPTSAFDWRLGNTLTRGFAGEAGGQQVVVFVAKEGPYQGRVLSAVVPDAIQTTQWGLP